MSIRWVGVSTSSFKRSSRFVPPAMNLAQEFARAARNALLIESARSKVIVWTDGFDEWLSQRDFVRVRLRAVVAVNVFCPSGVRHVGPLVFIEPGRVF